MINLMRIKNLKNLSHESGLLKTSYIIYQQMKGIYFNSR